MTELRTLVLLNEKGGVCKTTLATHIGAGLAARGYRTVVVDADAQGQVAKVFDQPESAGLYNLLVRQMEWRDCLVRVPPTVYMAQANPESELYILPGNIETRGIAAVNSNPFLMRDRVEELEDWADAVIFDTGPTPSQLHTTIWMAADMVLYPTTPTYLSLDGLVKSLMHSDMAQDYRRKKSLPDVERLGIIPTLFRSGTIAHDKGLQQLLQAYKRAVWPSLPLRTVWEQAMMAGELIYKYAPNDEAVKEMLAIVDRVEAGLWQTSNNA